MNSFIKKGIAVAVAGASLATVAAPAEARRYYRHHDRGSDTALAVGAGIVGLGLVAALASSNRGRYYDGYYGGGYYDRGYYPSHYGYYNHGYSRPYYRQRHYPSYGYGYGHGYDRCTTRWRINRWGERVRVRRCRY